MIIQINENYRISSDMNQWSIQQLTGDNCWGNKSHWTSLGGVRAEIQKLKLNSPGILIAIDEAYGALCVLANSAPNVRSAFGVNLVLGGGWSIQSDHRQFIVKHEEKSLSYYKLLSEAIFGACVKRIRLIDAENDVAIVQAMQEIHDDVATAIVGAVA